MNDDRQSETLPRPSTDAMDPPLAQAATVACAYLEATRQAHKNQSFEVLAALALSTQTRARAGLSTDFSAVNLKASVAPHAAKEPSSWLSPIWTRLTEIEPQLQEGLIDTARNLGLGFTPRLSKLQGSPSVYSIEAVPLPPATSLEPVAPTPEGGVHYLPETVAAPAAWLSSALQKGVVRLTVGLRWTILGAILMVTFVALGLLWLTFALGLKVTRPLSLADLMGLVGVVGAIVALIPVYRFLDHLFELRIVMAPGFLTSISQDNVTLEFRRSAPGDTIGELAFVRYTSTCPLCGGGILIDSGRAAFPDRLVGRCVRSAREHVFSFDHVSRVGRPLIQ